MPSPLARTRLSCFFPDRQILAAYVSLSLDNPAFSLNNENQHSMLAKPIKKEKANRIDAHTCGLFFPFLYSGMIAYAFASIKKTDKNFRTLIRHLVVFSPASSSCMRWRIS